MSEIALTTGDRVVAHLQHEDVIGTVERLAPAYEGSATGLKVWLDADDGRSFHGMGSIPTRYIEVIKEKS